MTHTTCKENNVFFDITLNLREQSLTFYHAGQQETPTSGPLSLTKQGPRTYFYYRERSDPEQSEEVADIWGVFVIEFLPDGDFRFYAGEIRDTEGFDRILTPEMLGEARVIRPEQIDATIDSGTLSVIHFHRWR